MQIDINGNITKTTSTTNVVNKNPVGRPKLDDSDIENIISINKDSDKIPTNEIINVDIATPAKIASNTTGMARIRINLYNAVKTLQQKQ